MYVDLKCEFKCCNTNSEGMTGGNDWHVDAAVVIFLNKASFPLSKNSAMFLIHQKWFLFKQEQAPRTTDWTSIFGIEVDVLLKRSGVSRSLEKIMHKQWGISATYPHWSYELISQITPWQNILCSYIAEEKSKRNSKWRSYYHYYDTCIFVFLPHVCLWFSSSFTRKWM